MITIIRIAFVFSLFFVSACASEATVVSARSAVVAQPPVGSCNRTAKNALQGMSGIKEYVAQLKTDRGRCEQPDEIDMGVYPQLIMKAEARLKRLHCTWDDVHMKPVSVPSDICPRAEWAKTGQTQSRRSPPASDERSSVSATIKQTPDKDLRRQLREMRRQLDEMRRALDAMIEAENSDPEE